MASAGAPPSASVAAPASTRVAIAWLVRLPPTLQVVSRLARARCYFLFVFFGALTVKATVLVVVPSLIVALAAIERWVRR
jgi:hypothetical protein